MAVSDEKSTREAIQEKARKDREWMARAGMKVPTQEQLERKARDVCERQDKEQKR